MPRAGSCSGSTTASITWSVPMHSRTTSASTTTTEAGVSWRPRASRCRRSVSGTRCGSWRLVTACRPGSTAPVFVINGLKREELIATNSMILHELYFDGLGDGGAPDTALREALARDFGSQDRWRAEFVAMGKAMGGGSGWVLLTYSHRDRRLVNQWAADHTHSMAGGTPILALDMYEHSYHIDYGAAAAKYVDAF